MCLASRIWLVVMGPCQLRYKPHQVHCLLWHTHYQTALNAAVTVCSSLSNHLPLQSSLVISSYFARSYKAMSKVMTVFLLGPTTTQWICSVCFRTVTSVCHLWAGAFTKGRALTSVRVFSTQQRVVSCPGRGDVVTFTTPALLRFRLPITAQRLRKKTFRNRTVLVKVDCRK